MARKQKHTEPPVPQSTGEAFGFVDKHSDIFFYIIMAVAALSSLLLFNMRIDEGGDDATYICRAIDFVAEGRYPNFQGPLYPMFLGLFIALFGTNILVLKLTSLVLMLAGMAAMYYTLRNGVNRRLLLSVLALLSVNSMYLCFASQTYSEALFILLQFLFFGTLMRYEVSNAVGLWRNALAALPPAAMVVLALFTRTVGGVFGLVGVAYLCLRKKYSKALALLVSIVVLSALAYGVRYAAWGSVDSGSKQLQSLMQKHPYEANQGMETPSGYLMRVVDNSKLYLSKHAMCFLGLKKTDNRETSMLTTVVLTVIFAFGAFKSYRRNRYILFMSVCVVCMFGVTFVILQPLWDQFRLIVPYMPMALFVFVYGAYHLLRLAMARRAGLVTLVVVMFVGMLTTSATVQKVDTTALRRNADGDKYYGYTPDWYNYLAMCEYAANNLPADAYVACRKPNMARIYANGRKFFGIYNFASEDADELLENLRTNGVTHIVIASLRRDPLYPGNGVINTLHRYMSYIVDKYPQAFRIVTTCGVETNEPAYLFEVDYNYVDAMRQAQNVQQQ